MSKRREPEANEVWQTLAQGCKTLLDQHRYGEAVVISRQLHREHPESLLAALMLGHACRMLGYYDEARAAIETALSWHPYDAHALYNLTLIERYTPSHPRFRQTLRALEQADNDQDRATAHFALARMYEDGGDHDRAFAAYQAGNVCQHRDLARQSRSFDRLRHAAETDAAIEYFDAVFFSQHPGGVGTASKPPVLVLGVSRAGKTLLANLLAAHPLLVNLDERTELGSLIAEHAPVLMGGSPSERQQAAQHIADGYLQMFTGAAGPNIQALDTNPANFRALGLLAMILPDTRVIYLERERQDLLLANYFTLHRGVSHGYSCDLVDCQAYIDDYTRLMKHWRALSPLAIHTVRYETLVEDPDHVIAGVLEFLGLEWDEACASRQHESTAIDIPTPAASVAVKTTVNADQVGFSRHYARQLTEFFQQHGR